MLMLGGLKNEWRCREVYTFVYVRFDFGAETPHQDAYQCLPPLLWLREAWPPALKLESMRAARSAKRKSRGRVLIFLIPCL